MYTLYVLFCLDEKFVLIKTYLVIDEYPFSTISCQYHAGIESKQQLLKAGSTRLFAVISFSESFPLTFFTCFGDAVFLLLLLVQNTCSTS